MNALETFRIVLIKPSKYSRDGRVERFRKGFMPNSTLLHIQSLTPAELDGRRLVVETIDEYTQTDLRYLQRLRPEDCSLLALVGVQSHQMQRALDLAALARTNGVRHCVLGGPHPMTCDTSEVQGHGVSFALAEAELIWTEILRDAMAGELRPVYGEERRWQGELDPPALVPPSRQQLRSYVVPMLGIYPARGCPYSCNFCSVVKIAGKRVRSQPVETTVRTLLAAREAGVRLVMFTSDNFNKYPQARELLKALVEEKVGLPFLVQCDVQLSRDEELVSLLAKAGCVQVFVGVESFSRATLKAVHKNQNDPSRYADLVRLCHRYGITTHFSNIFGFPDQDEAGVLQHLRELCAVRPFMASFYVLTPIPGTDQYDEFLDAGLITGRDLDAFDATRAVWDHPQIRGPRLEQLLFHAYHEFYGAADVLAKMFDQRWNAPWFVHGVGLGYAAVARLSAYRGMHPMSGGFWRVRRDRREDYQPMRRRIFGIDRLALPASLALSSARDRLLYHETATSPAWPE